MSLGVESDERSYMRWAKIEWEKGVAESLKVYFCMIWESYN
jgi:hypothetical protein